MLLSFIRRLVYFRICDGKANSDNINKRYSNFQKFKIQIFRIFSKIQKYKNSKKNNQKFQTKKPETCNNMSLQKPNIQNQLTSTYGFIMSPQNKILMIPEKWNISAVR